MRRAPLVGTRVDAALLAVCILFAFVLKASTDSVREGLAAALRRTILAPMFSMQASVQKWRAAVGSVDSIVASRDSVVLRANDLAVARAENERLSNLLMLGGRLNWGFVPARVLHQPTSSVLPKTLVIDVGECRGVVVSSPVVSVDGLVGIVTVVDRCTSTVGLWTNSSFSVSAATEDGTAFGIVTPHLDPGAGGYLLELQNVSSRHVLKEGTRIVTAGKGGVYPAMIPIGTIVSQASSGTGWASSYLVRPAVMPQDLTAVMILSPARVAQGVEGVWLTPGQSDSLSKLIAAKGDSAARVRYQAELKAQSDSAMARIRAGGGGIVPGARADTAALRR